MKVTGSAKPERVWVRYIEDGNAVVRLRDNIAELADDVVDGQAVNLRYEYDEVEVTIADREKLTEYVMKNFATLFAYGLEQMNRPKEKSKDERIAELELERAVSKEEVKALQDMVIMLTFM
ncbi:hypothetical protein PJK55_14470 [Exiguobacterium sp. MMG028]|uniref:hypothetical protein n=1 Tax=Exiguobacterium sp. MMG028 TaxID=3021979 RepID=UPI0022FE01C0|nr:hypothetical protein [Exiguobacterium sp. MMG028]MDA5561940.1 hypothetical protein [Exiguobacterium sp. MMG028]